MHGQARTQGGARAPPNIFFPICKMISLKNFRLRRLGKNVIIIVIEQYDKIHQNVLLFFKNFLFRLLIDGCRIKFILNNMIKSIKIYFRFSTISLTCG